MRKFILPVLLLSALFLSYSCGKNDGAADYGNAIVYMPQASVNGGLDNLYAVPSGDAENTYNYKVDDSGIEVFLGVVRSGKLNGDAFDVDVTVSQEKSAAAASAGGYEAMPSSMYSLPASVHVDKGENRTSFFLTINRQSLSAVGGSGKKLALVVALSNPTRFELSAKMSEVTVVVDVDSLLSKTE